jgi:predicted nucleic acid-binding protein
LRTKRRVIKTNPEHFNHFLVDACFLVNKYLNPARVNDAKEKNQIQCCQDWWRNISSQLKAGKAKVFAPDIVIAEAFKTLAKKNFKERIFKYPVYYKNACERLRKDMRLSAKKARSTTRKIAFHDIQMNRDIIISVDRFFEKLYKKKLNVGIVDLLLLATGKYLMDFYGLGRDELFIVTIDTSLYRLARSLQDIPPTFNPMLKADSASSVFRTE